MTTKDDDRVALVVAQIQEHLKSAVTIALNNGMVFREPLPPVVCNDGTVLSVQAGEFLYCTPRNNDGPWTHVEVMVIRADSDPHFWDVSEDRLGAFVPIEDVAREILQRGFLMMAEEE